MTHEDGQAHGSGRSIAGYHLLDALTTVHNGNDNLFTRFGGHAHAVGFSLPSANIELLRRSMEDHSEGVLVREMLVPAMEYDAEVAFDELNLQFYNWLEKCAPFGIGNREPVFVTRSVTLSSDVRIIKERHVCLEVTSAGARFTALGWSRAALLWTEVCQSIGLVAESKIDIAYRLRSKSTPWYVGLELELVDLQLSQTP
jgi:single-stranded-DNA-specific exonuclease